MMETQLLHLMAQGDQKMKDNILSYVLQHLNLLKRTDLVQLLAAPAATTQQEQATVSTTTTHPWHLSQYSLEVF